MIGQPRRAIGIAAAAMLMGCLSGCWTISPSPHPLHECWSDPEQLAERSRSLAGVGEDRALDAAERLLRAAWGEDAKVRRSPHGFTATVRRERTFYLFLVAHRAMVDEAWAVATRPEAGGTALCAQVQGQYVSDAFVLGAEPVTNVIYPATATEHSRPRFLPPAQPLAIDFDTFWGRLDYLAGLQAAWPACPGSGPRQNPARGRVEFDPLCQPLADDPGPPPPAGAP